MCSVRRKIQCYTTLLLDNSKVHISHFIFYLETWKLMVTTLISFPVLFQSTKLSNPCIFRISFSFDLIYFRKIIIYRKLEVQIVMILSSEGS